MLEIMHKTFPHKNHIRIHRYYNSDSKYLSSEIPLAGCTFHVGMTHESYLTSRYREFLLGL